MEAKPKLFSIGVLAKAQEKLQNDVKISEQEAFQQKQALEGLVEKIALYHHTEGDMLLSLKNWIISLRIKSDYYKNLLGLEAKATTSIKNVIL